MCENCVFYVYDDDCEYYTCTVGLDEDEMYSFITGNVKDCPYFRDGDDYKVVRHQN